MRYTVYNPLSGQDLGTYEADSPQGAILACVKDAGYDSIEHMEESLGQGSELCAAVFADNTDS